MYFIISNFHSLQFGSYLTDYTMPKKRHESDMLVYICIMDRLILGVSDLIGSWKDLSRGLKYTTPQALDIGPKSKPFRITCI